MTEQQILVVIAYLVFVNFLSLIICIFDKFAAKKGMSRVPEKVLFLLCFLGGSAGMLSAMKTIRHKTLHKRFMIGIPFIIVLQLILVVLIIHLTK